MNKSVTILHNFTEAICINCVHDKQKEIYAWLEEYEKIWTPLYTSVDIRDGGFKIAAIDTNLFPAGFNNLCEHGIEDSIGFMKAAIYKRVAGAKRILIVAEEHTRNTWYLENVRVLEEIVRKAGFDVKVATFLSVQPAFCEEAKSVDLETATGAHVKVYCFKRILNKIKSGEEKYDLIIMNNDLTTGIPDVLKEAHVPVYPSMYAGWHSRTKSQHFMYTNELMNEFAKIVNLDPWLFSSLFTTVDNVNINEDADRARVAGAAEQLFKDIKAKYAEHGITSKPFIFMKADAGTYGMGVLPIEDPKDILDLNRKEKNKLYKGKSSQVISRYLLQEGVPTIHEVEHQAGEVCIYQIDNNLVGGFYRFNKEKSSRQNLNSPGAEFQKICPHSQKYGDCAPHPNTNVFDIYRILARIAGIAASREIKQLEKAAQ
jgi:glutamate--cysteine ligase